MEPLRLIRLEAENVKRLVAIDIDLEGNLVQIASEENGEGKSTTLDCIVWALEGAKNIQDKPIRTGWKEAYIRLTLGDKDVKMIVTREFKINKKGETTTKLIISNPDGSEYALAGGAQELLNTFLGAITFDPLRFSNMDSKSQFDYLKAFVPSVDFKSITKANEDDYNKRKDINRDAKVARTNADSIFISPDISKDAKIVDEQELIKKLETASVHNNDITERATNRRNLANEAVENISNADKKLAEAKTKADTLRLEAQEIEKKAAEEAKKLMIDAKNINEKLAGLKPLPDLIDIQVVSAKLSEAKKNNSAILLRTNKEEHEQLAESLEQQSEEITKRMEKREEEKRKAIAEAKIPVENLSFGDDSVLLDGQPWEQGSEAQRIVASTELAIAQNPFLKLVIIKQGSLLSEKSKKIVLDVCTKRGFHALMETVGTSSKVGNMVIIENGRVKTSKQQEQL